MEKCATPLPPDWGKERRRRRIRKESIKNGVITLTNKQDALDAKK